MTCTIRCDICSTFLCNDHARYSMNKEQGVAGASYKSFYLCSRKSCDILSLETVHAQFPQDFSESGNFCGICNVTLTSARHADCSRIKVACHWPCCMWMMIGSHEGAQVFAFRNCPRVCPFQVDTAAHDWGSHAHVCSLICHILFAHNTNFAIWSYEHCDNEGTLQCGF